jgi:hypothetical protein
MENQYSVSLYSYKPLRILYSIIENIIDQQELAGYLPLSC